MGILDRLFGRRPAKEEPQTTAPAAEEAAKVEEVAKEATEIAVTETVEEAAPAEETVPAAAETPAASEAAPEAPWGAHLQKRLDTYFTRLRQDFPDGVVVRLNTQHKKLAVSGLDKLLDHFFISDEIGIEKPNIGFFDAVWAKLGSYDPADVLIVGDSLTSDIKGGNNAGIRTCWFNPNGAPLPQDLRIDYDIRQIPEVLKICELA